MRTLIRFAGNALLMPMFVQGCYAGDASPYRDAGHIDGGVTPGGDGTPCAVAGTLTSYCVRCHNGGPLSASSLPLNGYDALTAKRNGTSVGELAISRLRDAKRPMPPRGEPAPDSKDVDVLAAWVMGGYVPEVCGSAVDAAVIPDPYDTPTTCTSDTQWTGGNEESPNMRPGGACISCHTSKGEGPRFQFAGTLYPSAHEPSDCNGAPLETRVIIVDAEGTELALTPNRVGNFSSRTTNLVMPYTVRLERGTSVREMVATQTNGDCNSCHTEKGKDRAPGRVMAP